MTRKDWILVVFEKGKCLCMCIDLNVLEHKSGAEGQGQRKALGLL